MTLYKIWRFWSTFCS